MIDDCPRLEMVVCCSRFRVVDCQLALVLVVLRVSFLEVVVVEFLLADSVVSLSVLRNRYNNNLLVPALLVLVLVLVLVELLFYGSSLVRLLNKGCFELLVSA